MTSIPMNPIDASVVERRDALKIAIAMLLVVVADWLFYDRRVGISAALFLACVAAAVVAANARRIRFRLLPSASVGLVVALLPLGSGFSVTGLAIGIAGTVWFAVILAQPKTDTVSTIREVAAQSLKGPWQSIGEIGHLIRRFLSGERASARKAALVVWIVPVALGAVFFALFVAANPLIENWLGSYRPQDALSLLNPLRIAFWIVFLLFVWSFVFIRRRREATTQIARDLFAADEPILRILTPAVIVRSLMVFNALFAVQTALDIAYLWGGVALPAGMSYATYAHRGAYPLVVAALLAGGFVLIAMRPDSDGERSPFIRKLVYLWTAQTLMLVISSILRLDLYVEVYSLTYLRLAAFIWMILVAIGLVLIAVRILLRRSNLWLVTANAFALTVALYIVSIANLPSLIAHYNVAHSRELSGEGSALDVAYITSLGPRTIPALDVYISRCTSSWECLQAKQQRNRFSALYTGDGAPSRDWRAWSYYGWRLSRYLKQNPTAP